MNITNDIVSAYIDTLYRCENKGLQELRAFAEEHRVPVIMKDTEGLLLNLFRIKRPRRILEIGAAIGYSSCCFADACGCEVVTVEADERAFGFARDNIRDLGFEDRVKVLFGDAREVLASMEGEEPFDIVFIDAAKSHYRAFWDLSLPLVRDDAIIVCDNILMKGMTASDQYDPRRKYKTSIRKMREFVQYINGLEYADTCILPVGDGVSISVIGKEKD